MAEGRTRFAAFLAAALAAAAGYLFLGRTALRLAYEGTLPLAARFLHADRFTLGEYQQKADAAFLKFALFAALFFAAVRACRRFAPPVRPLLRFTAFVGLMILFVRPRGDDLLHHLFNLSQVCRLLAAGQWPIYLLPDIARGMGLPVFVFYSVWVYLLPAAIHFLGLDFFHSLQLCYAAFLLVGAAGIHRAMRESVGEAAASAGALLYLSANYFIGVIFVRAAFAECFAASLLPFAFVCLRRWIDRGFFPHALGLLAVCAALFALHPPTLANFAPGLAVYALFLEAGRARGNAGRWARFAAQAAVVAAGTLLLTAFYWVPFVYEWRYVHGNHPTVPLEKSILSVSDYLTPWSPRSPGLLLNGFFLFGLGGLALEAWRRRRVSAEDAGLAAAALFYLFLLFPCGVLVWKHAGMVRAGQFVWRLIQPLSLFASVFVARRLAPFFEGGGRARLGTVFGLALAQTAVFAAANFGDALFVARRGWDERAAIAEFSQALDANGVNEFRPEPSRLPRVDDSRIVGTASVSRLDPGGTRWAVSGFRKEGWHLLPKFWNARYRLRVDGRFEEVKANGEGLVAARLDPSARDVELVYAKPGYLRIAEAASIAGWALFAGAFLIRRARPA